MKEELLTNKEKALYNILTIRLYGTPEFISRIDTMLNFSESYYKSLSDSTHLAEVYLYKGDVCYFYKPQYDSSAYFLKKAKNFATQKKLIIFFYRKYIGINNWFTPCLVNIKKWYMMQKIKHFMQKNQVVNVNQHTQH